MILASIVHTVGAASAANSARMGAHNGDDQYSSIFGNKDDISLLGIVIIILLICGFLYPWASCICTEMYREYKSNKKNRK